MANVKISELTETTSIGANDILPVVDIANTQTKKIKVSSLAANGPIKDALDNKVSKTGDTMSGTLTVNPVSGNAAEFLDLNIGVPSWGPNYLAVVMEDGSPKQFYAGSGDQLGAFAGTASKRVVLASGFTSGANSGLVQVGSGDAQVSGNSGMVDIFSGPATGGVSGAARLLSGTGGSSSGAAIVRTGAAQSTGPIELVSGNASAGNSGNILLYTGTATGTRGSVLTNTEMNFQTLGKITNLINGTSAQDAVTVSQLSQKQDLLVSATNIKTINGSSILGSGDLVISGGGGADATTTTKGIIQLSGDLSGTADSPSVPGLATLQSELVVLESDIALKQDLLVSATNIKTINGSSILGSGDLVISGGGGAVTSVNTQTGDVVLTKSDIGLSDVDNTSDADKPVSTATQTALDLKADSSALALKQDLLVSATNIKTINGSSILGSGDLVISGGGGAVTSVNTQTGDVVLTKSDIGLSDVDNVSAANLRDRATHTGAQLASTISDFTTAVQAVTIDASKIGSGLVSNAEFDYLNGVTSAIQTQLDTKQATITAGTTSQYWRGDKTFQTLNATAVTNTPSGTISSTTVQAAINELNTEKQATLVSATNIKTINGSSILGSGNLVVGSAYSASLISALDIDWSLSEIFYRDISLSSTFTFSNLVEGKCISIILTNTSGLTLTVSFPSGIYKEAGTLQIAANSAAVYTFIRANSKTYLSSVTGLSNV
jgi:hypothetical protein